MQSQESSSSYYQEKIKQPLDEELFLAFKEEIKMDNEALEMRLSNIKPKVDSNMITNIDINFTNLNKEMSAIMDRLAIQVDELEKVLREQSSRQLSSDTKNDDIRESENVTLSLEDELLSSILDEDKDIMECEKMPLVLERDFQAPSLVEKFELAIDKVPSLKEKQV